MTTMRAARPQPSSLQANGPASPQRLSVGEPGSRLPDDQILAYATTEGRALVTANIRDFVSLDTRYRAADQSHAGLIFVSTKTFPQNRSFPPAVATAFAALLSDTIKIQSGQVLFLSRG